MNSIDIQFHCINLKKRNDRWISFINSAVKAGFLESEIIKFDAIESAFGALGCAKSHASILFNFFINSKNDYICVFEDDFEFLFGKNDIIECILELNKKSDWDVLMLTGTSTTTFNSVKYKGVKKLFDAHSAAGYVVKSGYVYKLLQSFEQSIHHMKRFETQKNAHPLLMSLSAIDVTWKKLMRENNWFICDPLIGIQRPGFSDIMGKNVDYSTLHK